MLLTNGLGIGRFTKSMVWQYYQLLNHFRHFEEVLEDVDKIKEYQIVRLSDSNPLGIGFIFHSSIKWRQKDVNNI